MKRLLRAIEMLAWGAFFFFAALVLALRFWLLPDIERYRDDIVATMSRGIGLPVRIGGIEAGWLGLRARISLSDVRIYDTEGREALVLPSVDNVVSWRSLLHGELRLHSFVIDGPRLGVRRDAAGALYVAGIKLAQGQGERGFAGWLLGQQEIVIRNAEIEWRDELRGAPPLALSALDLRLVRSGRHHSLGLRARPPADLGSSVELRARLESRSLSQAAALSGRVYLELGYTDLAAWRAWVDYPLDLQQGQGALRVWAMLRDGELAQATADVALTDVIARLGAELPLLEIDSLRGRLQGRSRADGYELAGRGVVLGAARGPAMQPVDFQIGWKPGGSGAEEQGTIAASLIEFEPLAHLAGSLPMPAALRELLAELEPRGKLSDAKLEWRGRLAKPQRFTARSKFSELALRPWGALPGLAGLTGNFEATEAKGRVYLSSRKSELNLPRVFTEPRIALESLHGELDWEHDRARGFAVRVSSLSFSNEHFSGNLFGAYSHRGDGPGSLDLSAILNRADGSSLARYLPLPGIMGEAARNWLAGAIVAGEASDVRVRLRGDLRDFPFSDPATGQFLVTARVEKGVLDYASGWPRIRDIAGELAFERDRMELVGRSGAILGARLSNVRVSIPSLRGPDRHVLVSGQADGATGEFLKYVESSPVREMTGGFTGGMNASGRGKLRLKLDLPLGRLAATKVAGEYEFAGNQVKVHPQLPPIEQAAGRLGFTESSFTLHDVRGRLFGGTVAIAGGAKGKSGVEIVARGDASIEAARALLDHPWGKYVSGASSYIVTLRVEDRLARVSFESPLRGVESALPPPLDKAAADALPLRVEVVPAQGGERDRVLVALGDLVRAEALRRRQDGAMVVQRAAVWVSPEREQPIRLPERPGTLVYGSLAAFDLDRWLPLLSGGEGGAQAVAVDLKLGSLDAFGWRLANVAVRAGADAAGWSANVNADELAGDVSYRGESGGRLIARLERFNVPQDSPGAKPRAASRPSELPALDLVAEQLTFRGKALGRVEVVASRAGDDWRIDKLGMANPEASLSARGTWRSGAPSRTAVDFELEASDAGGFLGRVGHPGLVKGGKTRMQGSLSWQGDPATLDFATLSGYLQMQAEDGQFLEIEPGLGKLVALMSLQALPRRITLDFRDVFSKGFRFDRIAAAAQVERGVMTLKDFRMRGSAAEVEMSGQADLARETQDLRVRVVPSLGDSAAIGLGIVNPVAGVAAAIAQRLLKNPLGQLFAYDYSVTGSWSDPKVTKIQPPPLPETPNP